MNEFCGQELNRTTYNLCRMNMILHDVHFTKFDIRQEDTLEHPQHLDKRFEAVVANPPFSANWSASPLFMTDDRFRAMLADAAKDAQVSLRQIEARQQGPDHPILWNVPETDYFKFYLFQIV